MLWRRSDNVVFALLLGGAGLVAVGDGVECQVKGILQVGGVCSCCRWVGWRLLQAACWQLAGRQAVQCILVAGSSCMNYAFTGAGPATQLMCFCLPILLPQVLDDSEGPTTKREYQQMMVPGQAAPAVACRAVTVTAAAVLPWLLCYCCCCRHSSAHLSGTDSMLTALLPSCP
jgi:hypothetical protein